VRLSTTGNRLLSQGGTLDMHCGGAEANVLIALAALGHPTRMVSRVPGNALGLHAIRHLQSAGVDTAQVTRGEGRMALYFMEAGAGLRASEIVYDRAGSAFARAAAGDFDWNGALAGAAHLHLSGITPALSSSAADAALAAAREAKARGVRISFDGNYRPSLWAASDGRARTIFAELVEHADILFGNHRDIGLLLGREFSAATFEERRTAAEAAFAAFPNLSLIAATARRAEHAGRHSLSARADTREDSFETETVELSDIVDRIGGGDAFAAGVLHALIRDGEDIAQAARTGLALAALKHFVPGDNAPFTQADIDKFLEGERDVRR